MGRNPACSVDLHITFDFRYLSSPKDQQMWHIIELKKIKGRRPASGIRMRADQFSHTVRETACLPVLPSSAITRKT
jgi:hypothetical protein